MIFCDQDIDAFTQRDCGVDNSGIVAVAFVDSSVEYDTTDDLSSEAWWSSILSSTNTYIVKGTRGEYTGGEAIEKPGFAGSHIEVVGAEHEATVEFAGLRENRNFSEGININSYKMAFITAGNKLIWVDAIVTSFFKLVIPKDIESSAYWSGICKWTDFSNPVIVEMPDNIFDDILNDSPTVWQWFSGKFVQWFSGDNVEME